eukprot:comp15411_c0_seq2/m.23413 comp15411_c0_seq2/g.23413  ORF comp15411_c0_seq2/g.23413 comp15411_c0_seq2/m.23413 type:complete len:443 (-) comp15411_c0_seq2:55-1383(-)
MYAQIVSAKTIVRYVAVSETMRHKVSVKRSAVHNVAFPQCLFELERDLDRAAHKHGAAADVQFSRVKCNMAKTHALELYRREVPGPVTAARHETALEKALAVFHDGAIGSSTESAARELVQLCLAHWSDGRRLCGTSSLSGRPCVLVEHKRTFEGEKLVHSSGHTVVRACNCGLTQLACEDPFTEEEANRRFFEHMNQQCSRCKAAEFVTTKTQMSTAFYIPATEGHQLSGPGFADFPTKSELLGWQISAAGRYALTSRLISMRARNMHSDPNQLAMLLVGLEYECPLGHQFVHSFNQRQRGTKSAGNDSDSDDFRDKRRSGFQRVFVPLRETPVHRTCRCQNATAQLMRIHIKTPDLRGLQLRVAPVITVSERYASGTVVKGSRWSLDLAAPATDLRANAHLVIRLPFAYVRNGEPLLPRETRLGKIFFRLDKEAITVKRK